MFERQGEILPAVALIEFLPDNENMEGDDYHGEGYANKDHNALQQVTRGHSLVFQIKIPLLTLKRKNKMNKNSKTTNL